jgi:hypothetical protein
MRKPRTLGIGAAIVALAVIAMPATVPAKNTPAACKRAKSRTVAANSLVRVFTRPGSDGFTEGTDLMGCWKRTNRVQQLDYAYDDDYVSASAFDLVRLSGRFVAFHTEAYDVSCKAACPPDFVATHHVLSVVDLRSGRTATVASDARPAGGRLLADTHGAIAWTHWLPANQVELRAFDGDGEHVVDSGPIHPESVTLTAGGRLGWISESDPRSLLLKPRV